MKNLKITKYLSKSVDALKTIHIIKRTCDKKILIRNVFTVIHQTLLFPIEANSYK